MPHIRAIRNHIIFQFEDETVHASATGSDTSHGQFKETTDWGFEITSFDEGTKKARWVRVISVGKDVKSDIKQNSRILVEALAWTNKIVWKGIPMWRTDESKVYALDENYQK